MPNVPLLHPGSLRQMLGEATDSVKFLPQEAALRADAFELLAQHIASHPCGAWNPDRSTGRDGKASKLFNAADKSLHHVSLLVQMPA